MLAIATTRPAPTAAIVGSNPTAPTRPLTTTSTSCRRASSSSPCAPESTLTPGSARATRATSPSSPTETIAGFHTRAMSISLSTWRPALRPRTEYPDPRLSRTLKVVSPIEPVQPSMTIPLGDILRFLYCDGQAQSLLVKDELPTGFATQILPTIHDEGFFRTRLGAQSAKQAPTDIDIELFGPSAFGKLGRFHGGRIDGANADALRGTDSLTQEAGDTLELPTLVDGEPWYAPIPGRRARGLFWVSVRPNGAKQV